MKLSGTSYFIILTESLTTILCVLQYVVQISSSAQVDGVSQTR